MRVPKTRLKQSRQFAVEALEERSVPATFGVPWGDPGHLTLSFVPDGTPIAGHNSSLFQTLGALSPTDTWQRDVLRAFQTWAVNANINIGLTADGGESLGVAGASQHDARFGDIRVGAQLMAADALSISVPNDPALSGTLTGDVLVNTADDFNKIDLFAMMLHEAGHVFGLGESTDTKSPLFDQYQGVTKLTAADVASLQALYGTRARDSHEGSGGNDSVNTATTVPAPGGWNGATPLIAYGDVTTVKDLDVFAVRPPNGYSGALTVRLQSAGISLLAPRLSILDAKGRVLADAQASSGLGDVVTLRLDRTDANATYYLRVQGSSTDVFGVGSYGLAANFDAASKVSTDAIDAVLRGPYQTLSPNDINALFLAKPGTLLNNDAGTDDTAASATTLAPSPGYAKNSHYETVGSIASPTDTDFFRFQTASSPSNGQPLVLTATVRALAVNGTAPRATLIDRDGNLVPSQILANGGGTFTVQAVGVKAGGSYYLRIGPDVAAGSASTGNYAVTVQFGTAAAQLSTFARGSLGADATGASNLYVAESQLMNFVLSAQPVGGTSVPGSAVRMTIRDQSGQVVFALTAPAGDTVSGPAAFLTPGPYTVTFTAIGAPLAFKLVGEGVSDPVGPVLTDPTLTPDYGAPGLPGWFLYPDGSTSTTPYLFSPVMTA